MTENKDLYEQYEEAFFAMLMDKIADAEGAELIKQKEQIRYCLETENGGPFSYFEFSIHTLELTGTTSLQITDFAEPSEKEDAIDLWDSQIHALNRSLGI